MTNGIQLYWTTGGHLACYRCGAIVGSRVHLPGQPFNVADLFAMISSHWVDCV